MQVRGREASNETASIGQAGGEDAFDVTSNSAHATRVDMYDCQISDSKCTSIYQGIRYWLFFTYDMRICHVNAVQSVGCLSSCILRTSFALINRIRRIRLLVHHSASKHYQRVVTNTRNSVCGKWQASFRSTDRFTSPFPTPG